MFSPFPEAEVERAIELSGLSALVAERGGDYLCGENGSGLSGGEGQRVSIARSLLRRSEVLLVDEATAALDAATAYQVTDSILSLEGMTRILVTHSLDAALLRRCDRILALRGGAHRRERHFRRAYVEPGLLLLTIHRLAVKKGSPGAGGEPFLIICSHQLAEEGGEVLDAGVLGVAGAAGVVIGALGEEGQVLLLQGLELGGDAYVLGELADGVDGGLAVLGLAHGVHALDAMARAISR